MPSRSSRRSTRKPSRRSSRGSQRRSQRRSRRQRGGANESLAQGLEYLKNHLEQKGGAATPLGGAPLGDTGMLDPVLRAGARVEGLDNAMKEAAAQGSDMVGGGRKRNASKNSKNSKKSKKSKNSKKSRSRRQRGGFRHMEGAPYNSSPMLLSGSDAVKAGTANFSVL